MNNNQDNRNKKNGRESRDPLRTGLPLLALAVVIVLLFNWVYNSITAAQLEEKSYSDFLTMVQNNQLAEVQFQTDRVLFITKEEANQPGAAQTIYYTGLITGTDNTALVYKMQGQGVKVFQEPQEDNSVIGFILSNLLILGLTFFLLSLLMRKMGSTMGGLWKWANWNGYVSLTINHVLHELILLYIASKCGPYFPRVPVHRSLFSSFLSIF